MNYLDGMHCILLLISRCGPVKRVVMGLDRFQMTPCGFCFVEYYTHEQALDCIKFINGTKLDERIVRTDLDYGFKEGRQYGRGKSGGQVRDEFREDYDVGRGGWGKVIMAEDEVETVNGAESGAAVGEKMEEENPRFREQQDED